MLKKYNDAINDSRDEIESENENDEKVNENKME